MLAGGGADCDGVARRDRQHPIRIPQAASYSRRMEKDQTDLIEEPVRNEVVAEDVGKADLP